MRRLLLTTAALIFATAAAATAAEVDMSTVLLDGSGKPMQDCAQWVTKNNQPDCDQLVDLTLGLLAYGSLNKAVPNEGAADQTKRGNLALKVYHAGKVTLDHDESELIRAAIAKQGYPPVTVARALAVLDGTPPPKK